MNIVDALVVTLGLDSSGFDRGQKNASDSLSRISSDAKRSQQSFDSMARSMAASSNAMQNSMAGLPVLLHEIYGAIVQMTEQVTGVKQVSLSLDEFTGLAEQAAKEAREAADAIDDLGESAGNAADNINDAGDSIDDASEKTQRLSEEGKKLGREFSRSGDQMARSLRGVANELISVFVLSKGGSFLGGKVVDSIQGQADTGRKAANMGLSANELKTQEWLIQRQGGSSDEARQSLGNFYGALTAAQNSPDIPDWLEFLRSRGVELVDEKGDFTKPDKLLEDMADAFDSANLDQKTRKYFMQQMGFSDSYATLVGKGSGYIRQQTSEIEGQTGLTPEGIKNAQEFQRQSIESLQSLEGAWNSFIGENAPALTEALRGITGEIAKFGEELKGEAKYFTDHKDKHYSGIDNTTGSINTIMDQVASIFFDGDVEKAYEFNKASDEFFLGKKTAPDGVLYNPAELEGGPEDSKWNSLWYLQKRSLESKIQTRNAGETPSDWNNNPDLRAYDEDIWAEHQKRLDWEKKQSELIQKNGYKAVYPDPAVSKPFEQKDKSPLRSLDKLINRSAPPPSPENPNLVKDMRPVRYEGVQSVDDVANRIVFKESRGRRYDQNGNIKINKTSGATGEYQILPSTAHDPTLWKRYRVKPARDDSPDEYARVARDLIAAYHRKYNGDSQKIMSAYNAGDGATDSAIAKWGTAWRKHMPGETRGYMDFDPSQKNFGNYPSERLAKQPSREEQQTVAGMQKLMQGINEAQSMRSSSQQPFLDVPPQIRAQTSPAMSPGVQQAMSNDNRTVTSTTATRIDNVNVHVPGGNSKEIAGGIGSALQRHPLINGANYA